MFCAGATRAAVPGFYSRTAKSRSRRKDGFYLSARSFTAIQFSRPQAPRLSAEPLGEPTTLSRAIKCPPLGGRGKITRDCGEATLSAPSWLSKCPPTSTSEVYHPGTRCQLLAAGSHPDFQTDSGTAEPPSLGVGAGYFSVLDQEVKRVSRVFVRLCCPSARGRNGRSGACRPGESAPRHPRA